MLTFKEVSLTDQALLEQWAATMTAIMSHDLPGFPPTTPRMAFLWQKFGRPGFRQEHFVAFDGEEPVGRLEISFPLLDNLKNAYLSIDVMPSVRRRGIGRQLYDLALERVKAAGRTTVLASTVWTLPGIEAHDGGAGPAFAEAMGLGCANLPEVMRRLDLSKLDNDALDAMYSKALAASEGYRLVQWGSHAPDELVEDIAYLDGRLIEDAPMGDLAIEPEKVDAERVRAHERAAESRGRIAFNTGAVHEESGRLVAWTCIAADGETPWHAWQNITIVDPQHRGHRLGALVKVANLRQVLQARPRLEVIDTSNAFVNSYMISINEEMGFRPIWAFQSWQREL
ncbi:GNAT family N-acetyltransferase [Rhizocola hellebori]|uniref:GNAT family N-acetyltransferase n=1 Tax=Rhizocola hellebori TaxID=1392758 RepID=A0A8J3QII4_9ACTN|nr:GNAT family N-acetyltransferase [Rhizocola hellebori]GIH10282.1 GNAT family N-acetyltransferase [Rhizocola hellebori]